VQKAIAGLVSLTPEAAAVIEKAADVAGLPSAQAEIDRGRLAANLGARVTLREGPFELPPGVKLSNAPLFRLEDAELTVIYAAEASCRNCSADLEELGRQVPKTVRVLTLPPGDDQDAALRQVLQLYKRPWPLLLGHDLGAQLKLEPRSLLMLARGGWTQAVLKAPFGQELGTALQALQRKDVQETAPRRAGTAGRSTARRCRRSRGLLPRGSPRARTRPSRRSSTPRSPRTRPAVRARRRSSSTRSRRRATAGCCPRKRGSTARSACRRRDRRTPRAASCSAPATAASRTRWTSCSSRSRDLRSRVESTAEVLHMAETAVIETKFGEIEIEFLRDKAPGHVKNFLDLAKKGFYDGTTFHRVIPAS
jgi:hypothetical protein